MESIEVIMSNALSRELILKDYIAASERGQPYTWFNYQPINLPGYEATLPLAGRDCFDRVQAIAQAIDDEFDGQAIRVIDWGCNLGFFAFELARRGHEVVGVDSDRRAIDVCRYIAEHSGLAQPPRFFCDTLAASSIPLYGDFDAAICLSVLHHLRDERQSTIRRFASQYPYAFIEMDGRNFGHHDLSCFYWSVQSIAQTNDRYGTGTRRRHTWRCSNTSEGSSFQNLKANNFVGGRGVFCKQQSGITTVIKREALSSTHTWIRTDLRHELAMYRRWPHCRFFTGLVDFGEDEQDRWIEFEYVKNDESKNIEEIREFFRFLEDNRLFMLDISRDAFLFRAGRLKVVDLESLFPVAATVSELVTQQTSRSSIRLDTYQKQFDFIAEGIKS